jgi:ABC-type nitrate/sulfonate/bicarbonate transport system substrate-binding protein
VRRLRLIAFSRAPGFDAAERSGAFAAEGLEIEVIQARGSEPQLASLAAGECDLVHTAADNVLARVVDRGERDLRIYLVGDLGLDLTLVARGVRSTAELAGKRLGVDATWSGHALLLYALLERAGVARADHVPVPVGGTAQRLDALLAGTVDAALLSAPFDAVALAAGAVALEDCRTAFPRHPGLTVAARPSWAAAEGEALAGYLRALIIGQRSAGAAVPSVAEQRAALLGALRLRRSLTGGPDPAMRDVDLAFDGAPALRADGSLDR